MFGGVTYQVKPARPTYNYKPARKLFTPRPPREVVEIEGGTPTLYVPPKRWEYLITLLKRPAVVIAFPHPAGRRAGWIVAGLDEAGNVTEIDTVPPWFFSSKPPVPVPHA